MSLRSILNRLTEDELELLQEEIDEGLYEEIERVLDDKRQPVIFTQDIEVGDVFIDASKMSNLMLHKIKTCNNPYYVTELLNSNARKVVYVNYGHYKSLEMSQWKKVDMELWDKLMQEYSKVAIRKEDIDYKFMKHFDKMLKSELVKK